MLVMELATTGPNSLLVTLPNFLPPVGVALFLVNRRAPIALLVLGVVAVLLPLKDAHKFIAMPQVTIGMYVILIPMLLCLIYAGYKSAKNQT